MIQVESAWYDLSFKALICVDQSGERYTIPSDKQISVTMIEMPEVQTMPAHYLSLYIGRGYTIEQIAFAEEG